jgi:N-acetyl sugar amidotransferase
MLIYCKKCVLPNTRPNINIDVNGICDACKNKRKKIDWVVRKKLFLTKIRKVKNTDNSYDCIIPVSGGKDSTWQVIVALKYGLRPLCVTWRNPDRTKIGQKNLDNLINLGVDHVDLTINPKILKYFTKKAFVQMGNPALPMHMAIHSLAQKFAYKFGCKLIIWGENSADEYGSNTKKFKNQKMVKGWLKEFGVTNGTVADNWYDHVLNKKNMEFFKYLEISKLKKIESIFLGYYFKWDPKKIYKLVSKKNFVVLKSPKVGIYNYADIDDNFLITIHHWIKLFKFGITREWDNYSLEIRNKRISRDKVIMLLKRKGIYEPKKEIKLFCKYIGISEKQFFNICNKFRNKKIWKKNKNRIWEIKNFLIPGFNWK